jgi:hypothetical protein
MLSESGIKSSKLLSKRTYKAISRKTDIPMESPIMLRKEKNLFFFRLRRAVIKRFRIIIGGFGLVET